jgi:hypothetical protein
MAETTSELVRKWQALRQWHKPYFFNPQEEAKATAAEMHRQLVAATDSLVADMARRGMDPLPLEQYAEELRQHPGTAFGDVLVEVSQAVATLELQALTDPARAATGADSVKPLEPLKLLCDWESICDAVGHPYKNIADLRRLKKADPDCPIRTIQGGKPTVEREALISWWNRKWIDAKEATNQRLGREAVTKEGHAYGRDGRVIPGISGHEKHRRKKKKV